METRPTVGGGTDDLSESVQVESGTNSLESGSPTEQKSAAEGTKVKLQEKEKQMNKAVGVIANVAKVGGAVANLAVDIMNSASERERLQQDIIQARENVKGVKFKIEQMHRDFVPMLQTMTGDLRKEGDDFAGQSKVGLTVKKWKVKGMLKNLKRNLAQFTNGMKVAEEFQLCVDSINEAMNLMIDLYDQIEEYEEKKQSADFIANINSAGDASSQIQDVELKKIIKKIELSMQANMFVEDYHRAIGAFKQFMFPFAGEYLGAGDPIRVSTANNSSLEQQELDAVVALYKRNVENLRLQMQKYRTTTVENDQNLIATYFSGDTESSHPFFVWTHKKWRGVLTKLLSGQKVSLKADMEADLRTKQMLKGKSAIKFKTIEVNFRAKNKRLKESLSEKLKHFRIKITHSGISVYKVAGQKFVISERNQTYSYSFEKRQSGGGAVVGTHLSQNVVNLKVGGTRADFLKSPYTWWTFQLVDLTPGRGIGHQDLVKDFAGNVDLELCGEGMYFDEMHGEQSKLMAANLAKFYQPYVDDDGNPEDIYSQLDNEYDENTCQAN